MMDYAWAFLLFSNAELEFALSCVNYKFHNIVIFNPLCNF